MDWGEELSPVFSIRPSCLVLRSCEWLCQRHSFQWAKEGFEIASSLEAQQNQGNATSNVSCYSSLLSGEPQTLSAFVASQNADGAVEVNGVDTQQPDTPFEFAWGDGSTTSGWFPAQHTYANAGQNYVSTITATENNGSTETASAVVFFVAPSVTKKSFSGVSFQIPSTAVQFQSHWTGYTPPTQVTEFPNSSFPVYSRSVMTQILTALASIDYTFANKNSLLLNGMFSMDMLENTNYGGGLSYWFTTPMSVGYGPTILNSPIQWFILFNGCSPLSGSDVLRASCCLLTRSATLGQFLARDYNNLPVR